MRPYTDHEWETLPHVVLTSDVNWDPTVLDNITSDTDTWFDAVSDLADLPNDDHFDQYG